MDTFSFNLQLFADEDTVDLATLKDQGFTDEELQEFTPKTEPTQEPVTEPTETPTVEPQQEEVVKDDVTIPTEDVEPHADNLKMALKEERDRRKVLVAELAALKAQQTTTTTPQQPAPVPQQQNQTQQNSVEEQIAKIADEKVRKALDIDEDIDTLQYSDPLKYLKYVKSVAKEEFKLETQYEQQSKVYNENVNFINELKSQQDFGVLYQFAIAELDELSGKEARPKEQAFARIDRGVGTKEDIETIRTFVNTCRAKMSGVATESNVKPAATPTTSPLDKAIGLPRAQNLSGAKTSAMSWAQAESLIREGKIDQIPEEMIRQIDPRLLE